MISARKNRPPETDEIENTPNVAMLKARQEWFERMGGPVVERNRWFLVSVTLLVALMLAVFAIANMLPLKTVVPYVIEVDRVTGETVASNIRAKEFVVDERQKKYFLGRWVKKTIELDPYTTEANIKEAFTFVRSKAADEYRNLMYALKPMERLAKEKGLSRVVSITSINFVADGSALVRFSAEERTAAGGGSTKRYVANIHYEVVPPIKERDIYENPNGIFITHFAIQEEIQ